MGANLTCTPLDDEQHSIHAASAFYPQSTLRLVSSETFRAADSVYIPLHFTPSPSPNLSKKNRLPKKVKKVHKLKLEPVISGESWDTFAEFPKAPMQDSEYAPEMIRRCVSDRVTYLKVKQTGKRSSVPVELLRKQLSLTAQKGTKSVPLFMTDESEINKILCRESTDRSGFETPLSGIFIDMDTTRSRPGWSSSGAVPNSDKSWGSISEGYFHEDNKTIRRRIGEILNADGSDSQFTTPAAVNTPVFTQTVRKFATEDEERCSLIVNELEETFTQLHRLSASTSKSETPQTGSPPMSMFIGGSSFPTTPVLNSTITFPCSPKITGSNSIGGAAFPLSPTPNISKTRCRVITSLERTRLIATSFQNPELLESMAKELEELSFKYAMMAVSHTPKSRSPSKKVC